MRAYTASNGTSQGLVLSALCSSVHNHIYFWNLSYCITRVAIILVGAQFNATTHTTPSSAEVKNVWNYSSISQYIFTAWCLVKNRDNFNFFTFTM
jgi:hypothetical protein